MTQNQQPDLTTLLNRYNLDSDFLRPLAGPAWPRIAQDPDLTNSFQAALAELTWLAHTKPH